MLDQLLQKRDVKGVGSTLPASLEPRNHLRKVARISLFSWNFCGRCSSELAQLVSLPYFRDKSIRCSSFMFHRTTRFYKDVYVNSFFLVQLDCGIPCRKDSEVLRTCLCNLSNHLTDMLFISIFFSLLAHAL